MQGGSDSIGIIGRTWPKFCSSTGKFEYAVPSSRCTATSWEYPETVQTPSPNPSVWITGHSRAMAREIRV